MYATISHSVRDFGGALSYGEPIMTTAFVLSGGGNLGALQVGMLQALYRRGLRPDFVVGTSVGSVNGAWVASHGPDADLDRLADVWIRMRRNDIFPTQMVGGLLGFVGRSDYLVPSSGLRRILRRELAVERLEETSIPLHVVATDITTGQDVLLSRGDLVDAVCASAAIPGVFPTVSIEGRTLIDGGVVNNCPISHAIALGATTVWVMPCGYACSLAAPPRGALGVALQGLSLMVQNRLRLDVEYYSAIVDLRVVPTLCPLEVSPTDFSQARRLIADADRSTTAWLADPTVGQRPGLHEHLAPVPDATTSTRL
jgi:NTE family protein